MKNINVEGGGEKKWVLGGEGVVGGEVAVLNPYIYNTVLIVNINTIM